jgi:hypothetical protein
MERKEQALDMVEEVARARELAYIGMYPEAIEGFEKCLKGLEV